MFRIEIYRNMSIAWFDSVSGHCLIKYDYFAPTYGLITPNTTLNCHYDGNKDHCFGWDKLIYKCIEYF